MKPKSHLKDGQLVADLSFGELEEMSQKDQSLKVILWNVVGIKID